MPTFNLITEPWIPVRVDGELELYSLEKTLTEAHTIERIEDASPLVVVALHRLLLAVLHRALHGPETIEECATWYEDEFPNEQIIQYLKIWKHRFDLFDETRPFYQIPKYENKAKSIAQLAAELSSGTNKLLFDHTMEDEPPTLPAAEVARLLIARQMLAIPEGAGYSPSPIGGTAVVLPLGFNLHETLCLNLIPYTFYQDDEPIWETDKVQPDPEQIIFGTAHRYTWMSRLIRLEPEELNGQTVVRYLHYGPACKLKEGDIFNPDPMLAYKSDVKTGERRSLNFRSNRAFWRDFTSLLPSVDSDSPKVVLHALNLLREIRQKKVLPTMVLGATNDKAKFEFWRTELHFLPEAVSTNRQGDVYATLQTSLKQSEDMGKNLRNAAWSLAQKLLSHGEREPHKNDVSALVENFPTTSLYWSSLEQTFPKLLSQLTENYDYRKVESFWIKEILRVADHAWTATRHAAGDNAFALSAIYAAEKEYRIAQSKLQKELESLQPKELV